MMKNYPRMSLVLTAVFFLACGGGESESGPVVSVPVTTVSNDVPAATETQEAVAKESAPEAVQAELDVTASKIEAPLENLDAKDIEAALRNGGWSTRGTTVSKPKVNTPKMFLSIRVEAKKGETTTEVQWFKGEDSWIRDSIVKNGGAFHQINDEVFLGVTISQNVRSSQALLDSLIGQ